METTRSGEYSTNRVLHLAFELGNEGWGLGFSTGLGQSPRRRKAEAGDLNGVREEIRTAKKRFGLAKAAAVKSCYEAGRDGFWLHRCLLSEGVEHIVVDSASIEVNRRSKRAKTDDLDVGEVADDADPIPHMERRGCGASCTFPAWRQKTDDICTGSWCH